MTLRGDTTFVTSDEARIIGAVLAAHYKTSNPLLGVYRAEVSLTDALSYAAAVLGISLTQAVETAERYGVF
jgi:hypothetical protein